MSGWYELEDDRPPDALGRQAFSLLWLQSAGDGLVRPRGQCFFTQLADRIHGLSPWAHATQAVRDAFERARVDRAQQPMADPRLEVPVGKEMISTLVKLPEMHALVVHTGTVTVGEVVVKYVTLYGHTEWREATEDEQRVYRKTEAYFKKHGRYPL